MATTEQLVIERTGEMTTYYSEVDFPIRSGQEPSGNAGGLLPRCQHGVYDPHGDGAACTLCQTDYDGQTGRGVPHLGPGDLVSGFQVEPEPRPRADAPEWVFDDRFLRKLLSETRPGSGRPRNIAQWAACLFLFYRCSLGREEISHRLSISVPAVRGTLESARKAGEKLASELSVTRKV